jgi:hypothetical protein
MVKIKKEYAEQNRYLGIGDKIKEGLICTNILKNKYNKLLKQKT